MKKAFKSFIFWFLLLSIVIIILGQVGQDSKSILLIGFNPILNLLSKIDAINNFINSGLKISCRNLEGVISLYWYIASILTNLIYGLLIDLIIKLIKNKKSV